MLEHAACCKRAASVRWTLQHATSVCWTARATALCVSTAGRGQPSPCCLQQAGWGYL